MSEKPKYEELEQRISELGSSESERIQVEAALTLAPIFWEGTVASTKVSLHKYKRRIL
jgi:hypothetical protein